MSLFIAWKSIIKTSSTHPLLIHSLTWSNLFRRLLLEIWMEWKQGGQKPNNLTIQNHLSVIPSMLKRLNCVTTLVQNVYNSQREHMLDCWGQFLILQMLPYCSRGQNHLGISRKDYQRIFRLNICASSCDWNKIGTCFSPNYVE